MAQIPMTPGRSRMPGTPDLRFSAGFVTPEDMGTRQFNEYGRLAQAIGHTGQELQQWQIRKYNEHAEADSLVGLNSAMKTKGEERNRLMLLQGSEAANAPQMYQDYAKKIDDDALANLKTPLAKEMYRRRMLDYDRQTSQSIDAHALQEDAQYQKTAFSASIDREILNASQNAGNGVAFADAMQRIKGYTQQLYRGQPQEYIDLQNQKYSSLAIEGTAGTLAQASGPQAALDFLNSGVEATLNDESLKTKFNGLRMKYQGEVAKGAEKQAVNAGTLAVTEIIKNGGNLGDAYVELIQLYGSDIANDVMANAGKYKGYVEEADKKAKGEAESGATKAGREAAKQGGVTREGIRDRAYAEYKDEKERNAFIAEAEKELEAKGKDEAAREKKQTADDKSVQESVKRMDEKAGIAIQEMARNMKAAGFSNEDIENRIRAIKPEMVKQAMAAAHDADQTRKADITAAELQQKKRLEDEFNQAGGIATNMPSYAGMGIEERTAYLKKQEEYRKASSEPDPKPNLDRYLDLVKLSDEDLNTRWEDKAQRDADIAAMGGVKSEWAESQVKRVVGMSQTGKQGKKEKPPEMATLDSELNNIKRDIDLNIADTGREPSKEERKVIVNRVLNQYNDMLNDYMTEKGLKKVTQVPVDQRKRMRAECTLTYQVETPGWLYGTNITLMTKAEADAAGKSTEGAGVVPQSLPLDLRQNYLGGTVRRLAQAHGDPVIANIDVPADKVPENVRIASENVGANSRIVRDMISGGFMVIGSKGALEFGSKGIKAREMNKAQADALRKTIANEYDPMALTEAEQARLQGEGISPLAGF